MLRLRSGILILIVVLFSDCGAKKQNPAKPVVIKDSVSQKIYPDIPEFPSHYLPLLSFFERHKCDNAFDTTVYFDDQGFGGPDNYYNFIHAGHIFSKTQIHAVVFYDIADKDYRPFARMIVYKKTGPKQWDIVLEDSTVVGDFRFRYKDWNCDGINDLSYTENGWEHGGHGPITWWLCLIDKKGIPHRVKGFDDLSDPKIDSYSHHIFSNNEFHTGEMMVEYKFSGSHILNISDEMIVDYDRPDVVTYSWNGKFIKKRQLKPDEQIYTPKHDVEEE